MNNEINNKSLKGKKNIYFAADQHFGLPNAKESRFREKKFIQWLDQIKDDCDVLFLLGDLFNFWFEYNTVVPKGYVRVLGKLAALKDSGMEIHFFVGNHDLWMKDYFKDELSIPVYHEPQEFIFGNKLFLIGHGDGLGPGDYGYKLLKKIFTNSICKFLYKWIHPDIGMWFASFLSVKNKLISGDKDVRYEGKEKEILYQYCKKISSKKHYDYFVFGHRHLPLEIQINEKSKYFNTGDWISQFTYLKFEVTRGELLLKKFDE